MKDFALNHRFRRYRAQSVIIREARKQGFDMKNMGLPDDLPDAQERVDKTSTPSYLHYFILALHSLDHEAWARTVLC